MTETQYEDKAVKEWAVPLIGARAVGIRHNGNCPQETIDFMRWAYSRRSRVWTNGEVGVTDDILSPFVASLNDGEYLCVNSETLDSVHGATLFKRLTEKWHD